MGEGVEWARAQFAVTAGAHFLFVALTLGLALLVALMQTRATVAPGPVASRMVRFWGQLYVINYAVGIVTGIVMELQLGLNWSGMTAFTGGVVGAPLAMETVGAFFVEATFLGLWIFGWDRLNRWLHLALIWIVAATATASAYFVLVANGWMQRPVGYAVRDGAAVMTDAVAVLTNPTALLAFGHVMFGGLLTAGLFVAAVSGWHVLRRTNETEFFTSSMRYGLVALLVAYWPTVVFGGVQFQFVQPTKQPGARQDEAAAEFARRLGGDPSAYVPPGWAAAGEIIMMSAWSLLLFPVVVALVKVWFGRWLVRGRAFAVLLLVSLPLPYVAMVSGWLFREGGRQPWAVYGLLTTRDAVSDVPGWWLAVSCGVFITLFAALVVVQVWLLARYARRGPDGARLGAAPEPVERIPEPSL